MAGLAHCAGLPWCASPCFWFDPPKCWHSDGQRHLRRAIVRADNHTQSRWGRKGTGTIMTILGAERLQGQRDDSASARTAIVRPKTGLGRGLKTTLGLSSRRQSGRRSMVLWLFGSNLFLAGCSTSADERSNRLLSDAITIEQEAVACNRSIASEARYQDLTKLLPLAAPYQASVIQMINTARAKDDEIRALTAWSQDMQKCRHEVIGYVRQSSLVSLALVLSTWADEDAVFVGVIQRKVSWGVAATRLRAIQVKLLSELTDRAIQIDAQLNSAKQAELSRRVAIFDALTNFAP
jgi:hypothetical protein